MSNGESLGSLTTLKGKHMSGNRRSTENELNNIVVGIYSHSIFQRFFLNIMFAKVHFYGFSFVFECVCACLCFLFIEMFLIPLLYLFHFFLSIEIMKGCVFEFMRKELSSVWIGDQ